MFLLTFTAMFMVLFIFEMIFSVLFKLFFVFGLHFVLSCPSWHKNAMNPFILFFVYRMTTSFVETLHALLFNRNTFEFFKIILMSLMTKYKKRIVQSDICLAYIKFCQVKELECITIESFINAHFQAITKAIYMVKSNKPFLQLTHYMAASVTVFVVASFVIQLLSYVIDLFLVFFVIGFIRRRLDTKYSTIVPVESIESIELSSCYPFVKDPVVDEYIEEKQAPCDTISTAPQVEKKSSPTLDELLNMPSEEIAAKLFPDPRTQMDCSLNFQSLLRMKPSMKQNMRRLPDLQTSEFCDQGCWIKCRFIPDLISGDSIEIYRSYTMCTQHLYLNEIAHIHLVKNDKGFGEIELQMKESGCGSKVFRSISFEEARTWTKWMLDAVNRMNLLDPMCAKCHSERWNHGSFVTYDEESVVINSECGPEPEPEPKPIVNEVPSKAPSLADAFRRRLPKKKKILTSSVVCHSHPSFQDEFLNAWDFEISSEENEWEQCRLEGFYDVEPKRFKIRIKSSWENPITVHLKCTESVSYHVKVCSETEECFHLFSFTGFHSNQSFELRCKSKDEAKLWNTHFKSMVDRTRIETIGFSSDVNLFSGPVTTATSMSTRTNLNVDVSTVRQHYNFSL